MAEPIQAEQDEERHEELGTAFMQGLVAEINGALESMGVGDAEQRLKLCSRLAFGVGNFLDQGWMEADGRKVYPLLCFSDEFWDGGTLMQSIGTLQLPPRDFELHAAAVDVAHDFFEKQGEE